MKALLVMTVSVVFCGGCKEGAVGPGFIPVDRSAKDKLEEVNSLAESLGKTLRLVSVSSRDIRTDGTSDAWYYQYVDTSIPTISYWFHASLGAVAFDSTSPTGLGAAVITHFWFNSDRALSVAEENGGAQFRNQNVNCEIVGSVGEAVVPNAVTTWWITYRSKVDKSRTLLFGIDATSGAVTLKYP